jgi:hypothetical protein
VTCLNRLRHVKVTCLDPGVRLARWCPARGWRSQAEIQIGQIAAEVSTEAAEPVEPFGDAVGRLAQNSCSV